MILASLPLPPAVPARHPSAALLLAALGVAGLFGVPNRVVAGWPPAGALVCQTCQGTLPVVVPDGTGGALTAWQDIRNGNDDIYGQRITASGEIAPGWPNDGVPLCTAVGEQLLGIFNPAVSDGSGGFIIPWVDYRDFVAGGTLEDIYAQRILAGGGIAPGWPVNGLPVRRAPSRDDSPILMADGVGGAFFSWDDRTNEDIYLQHLTAAGEVVPGWPADGLPICTLPSAQFSPRLASDGAGGVLIAWGDLRDGPLAAYAQRVTPGGQIAPGWPANGVRIVLDRAIRGLISDGAGGAYLACATFGPVFDDDYYLQRFMGDGTIAPGWPDGGVLLCQAPDERVGLRMVPDGVGGALIVWSDYRAFLGDDLFALRMQPDGSRYPGWPVDGLRVTDNTALDDYPDLAPDGMGGAYLTWVHYTTAVGDRVRVQHLTGAGTAAPGWPAEGAEIPSNVPSREARIVEDGTGGAIAAWSRTDGTIRALRFNADGPVAVAVSLVSVDAEPGRVRLIWFAADGASVLATVERRTETGHWQRLADVTADGTGRLVYEDRAVTPGARYAYRLSHPDGGTVAYTAETWVTVPAPGFALRGLTPNPSAGDPMVAFSLVSGEPATIELYDIHGRLVLSREVGSLGAGAQSVRLAARGELPPGVYGVRLRQGAAIATARAVVLR